MTTDETAADPTAAYAGFTGEVGRIMSTSTPAWTRPSTAPDSAPNVLVVLVDDLGYSDVGCYGSAVDTPNIARLAAAGHDLRSGGGRTYPSPGEPTEPGHR